MILFDGPICSVSQGFFSGWRIADKRNDRILVPDWLMKERIGLVWMQVRRTKKSASINSHFSEQVMFGDFALAVMEPSGKAGDFWRSSTPDEIADSIISEANMMAKVGRIAFRSQ